MYYVMFTTSTIFASFLLFRGFNTSGAAPAVSLLGGFVVIFMGVYLLNMNKLIDPVTQQPRMSLVTGEGISGTGRASESYERLMNGHGHGPEAGGFLNPRISMTGNRSSLSHSRGPSAGNEYWAAAAGRRDSATTNPHVLFNAYDNDLEEGGAMGLNRLDEDSLEEGDESVPMRGTGRGGARMTASVDRDPRNHRRSASLKTVVGTNGKVVNGGGAAAALGAVRK